MGDITLKYHQLDVFSVMAEKSIRPDKAKLLNMVVSHVVSKGPQGATSDEVEQSLGLSHQTASARLTEAKVKGLLMWSGTSRKTRSGRKAAVLVKYE